MSETLEMATGNSGLPKVANYFTYPPTKDADEKALVQLSRCLSLLQTMNRSMTLEQAQVFLMIALDEGKPQSDYTEMTGLAQGTMSRIFTDLSAYRRTRKGAVEGQYVRTEGYGLIELRVNPNEMRQKLAFLTPKGRAIVRRLAKLVHEACH
jgi:Transcriptional regulators